MPFEGSGGDVTDGTLTPTGKIFWETFLLIPLTHIHLFFYTFFDVTVIIDNLHLKLI